MNKLATRGENSAPLERKTYATPRLEEYGQIEKLTRAGGSSASDAAHTMKIGA